MGRSSEAWSNLTLPARFVKPEPASTTGTVGTPASPSMGSPLATISSGNGRYSLLASSHGTVPIAMRDNLRGRLGYCAVRYAVERPAELPSHPTLFVGVGGLS
jgi:hypothetical protein